MGAGRVGASGFPAHHRIKQKVFVRGRKHCCEPRASTGDFSLRNTFEKLSLH